jgi:hypothetical protein
MSMCKSSPLLERGLSQQVRNLLKSTWSVRAVVVDPAEEDRLLITAVAAGLAETSSIASSIRLILGLPSLSQSGQAVPGVLAEVLMGTVMQVRLGAILRLDLT